MTVKWVCSDCSSNNLNELSLFMQCEVCGKIRTTETVTCINSEIVDTSGIKRKKIKLSKDKKRCLEILYVLFSRQGTAIAFVSRIAMLCSIVCSGIYLYSSGSSSAQFLTYFAANIKMFLNPGRCYSPFYVYISLVKIYNPELVSLWIQNTVQAVMFLFIFYRDNIWMIGNVLAGQLENFIENACGYIAYGRFMADHICTITDIMVGQWGKGFLNIMMNNLNIWLFVENWIGNTIVVLAHIQQYCGVLFVNLKLFLKQVVMIIVDLREWVMDRIRSIV